MPFVLRRQQKEKSVICVTPGNEQIENRNIQTNPKQSKDERLSLRAAFIFICSTEIFLQLNMYANT